MQFIILMYDHNCDRYSRSLRCLYQGHKKGQKQRRRNVNFGSRPRRAGWQAMYYEKKEVDQFRRETTRIDIVNQEEVSGEAV